MAKYRRRKKVMNYMEKGGNMYNSTDSERYMYIYE
jgi:hypothetical protein